MINTCEKIVNSINKILICKWKFLPWSNFLDQEFHLAGDGKLAGILEPNPAKCYKDDEDYLIYDYPSISQINYVAKLHNINIIFAIVAENSPNIIPLYKQLNKMVENSNFGILDQKDSKNVINFVIENYKVISINW